MWLGKLFSESGEVSFGRVASFLALICVCTWVTLVIHWTHTIPPLLDPAVFVSSMYLVGKTNESLQKWVEKRSPNP